MLMNFGESLDSLNEHDGGIWVGRMKCVNALIFMSFDLLIDWRKRSYIILFIFLFFYFLITYANYYDEILRNLIFPKFDNI